MRINIKDIPVTGKHYEFDLAQELLELDITLIQTPHFQGTMFRSEEDVRVQGRIQTSTQVFCHRCLEPFIYQVSADLELFYKPQPTRQQLADEEIPVSELGILYYRDQTLDLTEALRDTILLEIPMKILCKPDCQGLCAHCGANKNVTFCNCHQSQPAAKNPFAEFFEKNRQ